MITCLCKYTPIELLEAFDTQVAITNPNVANFSQADTLLHPNLCSFVKAVLEDFEDGDYEGMLFTTCCDSVRRLYDTLKHLHPEKFFFCFDLPHKRNDFAVSLYVKQMERLIAEYAAFSGKTFDADRLAEICAEKSAAAMRADGTSASPKGVWPEGALQSDEASDSILRVCLAGARPGPGIRDLIERNGARIALDITCTGIARDFPIASDEGEGRQASILRSYAASLLGQLPCMRMAQVDGRAEALLAQADDLDGILYHTVKFCDIYSYEYTHLRETLHLPIVKLETDATSQGAGQIQTRVEAFLESLRARKRGAPPAKRTGHAPTPHVPPPEPSDTCYGCPDTEGSEARLSLGDVENERVSHPPAGSSPGDAASDIRRTDRKSSTAKKGDPMYILGIDSGSTSTNAVIINEKKEILSCAVLRTGAKSADSAARILAEVLRMAGLTREDLSVIVSTGYGRVSIPFADRSVTEISCHARGAHFVNPGVRTVLDIGGQDSKAIRLNENGDVIDFVMNDKCAAGTGRFLEMMADTLEIGIEHLGPLSLQAQEDVEISSMCSVFAESEVISLIAQNKEPADIARGIHRAIAKKAMSLLRKVGLEPDYMMTGGVAKNPGMVAVLEEMLGAPLSIYDEPEIVGALGAALYGLEAM